jgi:hypothetical protein
MVHRDTPMSTICYLSGFQKNKAILPFTAEEKLIQVSEAIDRCPSPDGSKGPFSQDAKGYQMKAEQSEALIESQRRLHRALNNYGMALIGFHSNGRGRRMILSTADDCTSESTIIRMDRRETKEWLWPERNASISRHKRVIGIPPRFVTFGSSDQQFTAVDDSRDSASERQY